MESPIMIRIILLLSLVSITTATAERLEGIENRIRSLDLKLEAQSIDFTTLKYDVADTNKKLDVLLAIMNATSIKTQNKADTDAVADIVNEKSLKAFEVKIWTELSRVKRAFVVEKRKLQHLQKRYDFKLQEIQIMKDGTPFLTIDSHPLNHSTICLNESVNAALKHLSDNIDQQLVNVNDSVHKSLQYTDLNNDANKTFNKLDNLNRSINFWYDKVQYTLNSLDHKVSKLLTNSLSQQQVLVKSLHADIMTSLSRILNPVPVSDCKDDMANILNTVQTFGIKAQYSFTKLVHRFSMSDIRLANSSSLSNGRLEVNIAGKWGTVCDDLFDTNAATVVCRMFGYRSGIHKSAAYFGLGTGPILMDNVHCKGTENTLWDCAFTKSHYCHHNEDVGVICID